MSDLISDQDLTSIKWLPCQHEQMSDAACPYCRIAALEAEVARLRQAVSDREMEKAQSDAGWALELEKAEAKLRAVANLVPEFYRNELEALIGSDANQ